ncbi:glycine--tRNA ligase subunit beta [Helicobacter burdigaliensis]|uniref:glycine--tRNA ligase subunit beta n=1 Tax=Helicobacter burdigaliensis TaxID=2315334 RepID=UPI000EF670D6|nr:glycine--tRNA ligase subunit beta [Helicobacter burdigaliensis]
MTTSLLLEIGIEEIPAIPFLKELPNIPTKFHSILKQYRLDCDFSFFYTPRRLVILSNNFKKEQDSQTLEFFGPPKNIAFKDNAPTNAALSFFKKCEISQEEATFTNKDGKEVLYCKKEAKKLPSSELLGQIVYEFLKSLEFGKTMRWGEEKEAFIRPIRSILALLEDNLVPIYAYGVHSKPYTFVHRSISYEPKEVQSLQEYLKTLQENCVILNPKEREEKILKEIKEIEAINNIKVELDEELLEEIVAITEYPTALFGEFEERFLEIPTPCIITSMKVNQRYFATYKEESLHNGFIVISNSLAKDFSQIIQGNAKVLRARLEDALFFYHNDLKKGLNPESLKSVTFIEGLGSMWDKTQKEREIVKILSEVFKAKLTETYQDFGLTQEILDQASLLSKADLMSEMVYEFTELQGIMGYYYAKAARFDERVAIAIKEQYLPNSEESAMPSNLISALIALSYKLDNLLGLFSINKIPTGSKDPFALRRAANGIIKIILHFNLHFDLKVILLKLKHLYKDFDINLLENFILERLESTLPFNSSLIRAVLNSNERDLLLVFLKLSALNSALEIQDKNALTQTFKRLSNITKDVDLQSSLEIIEEKLTASEEIELYNALKSYQTQDLSKEDYQKKLELLLGFAPILDRFFDKVLVNAPDVIFKNNRKHLIARIYKEFLEIADIKEISF